MKVVVDSCIFVSALNPKDIFHAECFPIFEKIIKSEISVKCPFIVLTETCCILNRRTQDENLAHESIEVLTSIPSIEWIDLTSDTAKKSCELGIKSKLKGNDSIILQTANEFEISLITKDGEIKSCFRPKRNYFEIVTNYPIKRPTTHSPPPPQAGEYSSPRPSGLAVCCSVIQHISKIHFLKTGNPTCFIQH
jgi:predicted nucleic acid-binding protein